MYRLALLILVFTVSKSIAGPLIQPGDIGLRHDIQVLADCGVIRGPVSTWPLSWDAIATDLQMARDEDMILPVAVEQTLQRMLLRAGRETQRGQHRFHGRLATAEEPTRIRSFENTPREDAEIAFLGVPPGNRLEKLRGNRAGQWSIRINDQFRICFVFRAGDAYQVEIVDYH